MPRTEAIALYRGDTWNNTLPIIDETGDPYDLTGASVWMTVKNRNDERNDDTAALFQLTIGSGLTVSSPGSGIVDVEISDDQTALLAPGTTYKYDVQFRILGETFTPIAGPVLVSGDVTRA